MFFMTGGSVRSKYEIRFSQSSNVTTGANAFTLMGSPSDVGTYRFIVESGVTLSSNSTGTAGLTVGAFPAGSTVIIENLGTIVGMGGSGGSGGIGAAQVGGAGNPGGNAISLATGYTVKINNESGNIWGGGGGGGGGAGYITGGGGGGGGASGSTNSSGGGGGAALNGSYPAGSSGGAGTISGPGSGGSGTGAGAAGGAHGSTGNTGSNSSNGISGGAGGAGGKAVALNGNSVTWLAGNNASQVKGAVS